MLAGIFFLLHIIVPHHHHADEQSIEEHRHIVEHNKGMHDEKEEEEHHHHKENIIEEITISSATIVQKTMCYHIETVATGGLPADYITIPNPTVAAVLSGTAATVGVFLPDIHSASAGLRAPPCF